MGEFARIFGVFFEPQKTFTDIARRPTWVVPLILVIASALGMFAVISQRVGWDRIVRHQMATSSRVQQMPADQREQMMATQIKFAPISYNGGTVIGITILYLIEAAVLLGIAGGMMGGGMSFRQVFAVVCYSGLPGIISAILTAVVAFLKNPDDFDLQNALAFNAGAFMDPNSGSKFVHSLATSMDLFIFWTIFLLATGLKAAAGKKLTFTGALVAVIIPWALVVLIKSGIAAAFG